MLGHYPPASKTPFKWRVAGGPIMPAFSSIFDPPSPHQLKEKKVVKVGPL